MSKDSKAKSHISNLDGWSKVIQRQCEEMRDKDLQDRKNAQVRAELLSSLPLEDVFTKEAAGASDVPACLRELLENAGRPFSDAPSPLTTALIRAANYWYQAKK